MDRVKHHYKFVKGLCIYCGKDKEEDVDCGQLQTDAQSGISVHNYCLLFASGLSQRGEDHEGITGFLIPDILTEYKRGKSLRCCHCSKKVATIGCSKSACRRSYHYSCAARKGALFLFFDTFVSYCADHRPQQLVPTPLPTDSPTSTCPICMDEVKHQVSIDTLKTPCCYNTWFHRACVQRQALSAGYFFRCAICNNQDDFQREMKQFGIYIPEHDASWEREENAYQDLYQRHDTCDTDPCRCPHGRKYNKESSKWELVLCDLCGSCGCHLACVNLKSSTQDWACSTCSALLSNATEANRPSTSLLQKSTNGDSPNLSGQTRNTMKLMGKHPRTPLPAKSTFRKKIASRSPSLSAKPVRGFCCSSQDDYPLCHNGSTSPPDLGSPQRSWKKCSPGKSPLTFNGKRRLSFDSNDRARSSTSDLSDVPDPAKNDFWKTQCVAYWENHPGWGQTLPYPVYGRRTTLRMSMRPKYLRTAHHSHHAESNHSNIIGATIEPTTTESIFDDDTDVQFPLISPHLLEHHFPGSTSTGKQKQLQNATATHPLDLEKISISSLCSATLLNKQHSQYDANLHVPELDIPKDSVHKPANVPNFPPGVQGCSQESVVTTIGDFSAAQKPLYSSRLKPKVTTTGSIARKKQRWKNTKSKSCLYYKTKRKSKSKTVNSGDKHLTDRVRGVKAPIDIKSLIKAPAPSGRTPEEKVCGCTADNLSLCAKGNAADAFSDGLPASPVLLKPSSPMSCKLYCPSTTNGAPMETLPACDQFQSSSGAWDIIQETNDETTRISNIKQEAECIDQDDVEAGNGSTAASRITDDTVVESKLKNKKHAYSGIFKVSKKCKREAIKERGLKLQQDVLGEATLGRTSPLLSTSLRKGHSRASMECNETCPLMHTSYVAVDKIVPHLSLERIQRRRSRFSLTPRSLPISISIDRRNTQSLPSEMHELAALSKSPQIHSSKSLKKDINGVVLKTLKVNVGEEKEQKSVNSPDRKENTAHYVCSMEIGRRLSYEEQTYSVFSEIPRRNTQGADITHQNVLPSDKPVSDNTQSRISRDVSDDSGVHGSGFHGSGFHGSCVHSSGVHQPVSVVTREVEAVGIRSGDPSTKASADSCISQGGIHEPTVYGEYPVGICDDQDTLAIENMTNQQASTSGNKTSVVACSDSGDCTRNDTHQINGELRWKILPNKPPDESLISRPAKSLQSEVHAKLMVAVNDRNSRSVNCRKQRRLKPACRPDSPVPPRTIGDINKIRSRIYKSNSRRRMSLRDDFSKHRTPSSNCSESSALMTVLQLETWQRPLIFTGELVGRDQYNARCISSSSTSSKTQIGATSHGNYTSASNCVDLPFSDSTVGRSNGFIANMSNSWPRVRRSAPASKSSASKSSTSAQQKPLKKRALENRRGKTRIKLFADNNYN